jgi:hypothetical protein
MNNPWQTGSESVPERPSWMTDEIEKLLKARGLPLDKDGMLMLWQTAKDSLNFYKEQEMEFRKVCASFLVPEPLKNEGMNTVDLGNNFQAKVGIKLSYKPNSDNKVIWKALEKIEKIGNKGAFIAERLFSWSPNFLLTEYRQLQEDAEDGSAEAKEMLKIIETEMITISEAAPTLEIKEAKKKK